MARKATSYRCDCRNKCFQFSSRHCRWWSRCNVIRKTVPELWADVIVYCDKTRCTASELVQDRCPGLSMSNGPSTVVLVRRLPACLWLRQRRLRSSDSLSCVVRRAHNTYGDRCSATAGPRVWNTLPAELQQCSSLRQFKQSLKTFLFRSWDYGALWLCKPAPYRNSLT